jgi:uncharacterized protein (TIGR03083 family)
LLPRTLQHQKAVSTSVGTVTERIGSTVVLGAVVPHLDGVDLRHYLAVRDRVASLVIGTDHEQRVPGSPAWSARDVVAHLSGLCEDWVAHRLDGYASQAWTDAQVARFAGYPVSEILERWQVASRAFAALPDDPVMGPPARWAFGDAVIHEADLRGAAGGGRVPHEAVASALKGAISRWRQVLADAHPRTLLVSAPDLRDWWIGTPDDPEAVTVSTPAYELFRALAGRRTEEQVRLWDWDDDPSPYIAAGLAYPFSWATAELMD